MTPAFPFEWTILALLFWASCAASAYFELRYNVFPRVPAKVRIKGSALPVTFAGFGSVAAGALCYEYDWGRPDDAGAARTVCILAVSALAVGCSLRFWVAGVLGRRFTKEITVLPGHRIVREGPYRLVRHPSYLGSVLTNLGYAGASASWIALALALALAVAAYSVRIRREEDVLVGEFGGAYRAYQRGTRRLVPFLY